MGRRPPQAEKKDIFLALADLDGAIIRLLSRRARLAAEAKPDEKRPAPAVKYKAWVEVEKKLRKYWDEAATGSGADRKLWRDIFNLVQQLPAPPQRVKPSPTPELSPEDSPEAESQATPPPTPEPDRESRGFLLTPRAGAMDVDIPGPGSLLQTRLWAGLFAQADNPASLGPVVVNDSLIECIKALNHAGARLYWEGDTLSNRGGGAIACNDKVIFAGNDLLTLHMLLFLALPDAGSMRITGGPTLKNFDSTPLSLFLPSIGARLVSVIPHSRGVPLRLESSGVIPDEIAVPETLTRDAILSLIIAAPRFPNGVTLRPVEGQDPTRLLRVARPALDILRQCGIDVRTDANTIAIMPGDSGLVLPDAPRLDLDPFLNAAFLALPRFARREKGGGSAGGSVRLSGAWPQDQAEWTEVRSLLQSAGLDITEHDGGLRSALRHSTGPVRIDASRIPDCFPLALVLAAAVASFGRTEVALRRPDNQEDIYTCAEVLEHIGIEVEEQDEWLALRPAPPSSDWDATWHAPTPQWTLAYALASYLRPGLRLDNPGLLSETMPRFWPLYNGLPSPETTVLQHVKKQKAPEHGPKAPAPAPAHKRIRV